MSGIYISKEELQNTLNVGVIVKDLHKAFLDKYNEINENNLKKVNSLISSLIFCLFTQEIGLFGKQNKIYNYLEKYPTSQMHIALANFFEVINTKYENRSQDLDDVLKTFPYIENEVFEDEIEVLQFSEEIRYLLLKKLAMDVDWSKVNPTIFSLILKDIFNLETIEKGVAGRETLENIHKVINPLFLDDLNNQFDKIKKIQNDQMKDGALSGLKNYLSALKFLDPACAGGCFLIETYISLRKLENKILSEISNLNLLSNIVQISTRQFYGVEIDESAIMIAKLCFWIAKNQMLKQTLNLTQQNLELSLKDNPDLTLANALRIDWQKVILKDELNYIISKVPCSGARWMSERQKTDVLKVFGDKWKNVGELDYATCWFKKLRITLKIPEFQLLSLQQIQLIKVSKFQYYGSHCLKKVFI